MNRAMHADDPGYDRIPESRELVAQYLLAYSLSGELEDLDSYVDDRYRSANILVLLKTDSTAYTQRLIVAVMTSCTRPGRDIICQVATGNDSSDGIISIDPTHSMRSRTV